MAAVARGTMVMLVTIPISLRVKTPLKGTPVSFWRPGGVSLTCVRSVLELPHFKKN
jgi:hypothetical protein